MRVKKLLCSILCIAMVLSTMGITSFAAGPTGPDDVALIAGHGFYVKDLQTAFTEAVNPDMKQVLMAKDWTGDIDINFPNFYSSFYLNGYTLEGQLKLTNLSTLTFYGIEPGNDWAGTNSVITSPDKTICQNSGANLNISGALTIEATSENGIAIYADNGKVVLTNENTIVKGKVVSKGVAIVKISAGTYMGGFEADTATNLEITGGTFAVDPTAYLPSGFTAIKGADDMYTIQKPAASLDDLTKDTDGKYIISMPQDVVTLREVMSKQSIAEGTEFILANDIDMSGYTLASAGTDSNRFYGIFDGNKCKISNVTIEGGSDSYVAFFGNVSGATIKDLTLENVKVTGGQYTAGIVGRARNSKVTNCKVIGDIKIEGHDGVGAIVGGGVANVTGCKVSGNDGSYIKGQWDVAGISGLVSAGTSQVENNSVSNVDLTSERGYAGGIAGRVLATSEGNNLSISYNEVEDITIASGDAYSSALLIGNTVTGGNGVVSYTDNPITNSSLTIDGTASNVLYAGVTSDANISVPAAKIGTEYYKTIQEAVNAAAPVASETNPVLIQLLAGEFEQSITLPSYISNVTFKGAADYQTVLKNSSVGHSGGMNAAKTNITFEGIDFNNSNINLTAIYENTKIENMTIKNCKFHDITGKAAVSINTNSLPNLVGFTFTGNTIENVGGGSFSGIVLRAAPTGNIVITDNIIRNVAWNAVQLIGATAKSTVTITGNTLASGARGGILNLYNIAGGVILENNTFNTLDGQTEVGNFAPVAKIGNKYFTSLAVAIEAAVNDDTITLLADASLESANIKKNITIDLAKNTLTVNAIGISDSAAGNSAAIQTWKNVTIKNGNINASSASKINNGIFYIGNKTEAVLTIDSVNLTAENTNGTDLFVSCKPGTLNIVNSVINAKNVSKAINGGDAGSVNITGSEISVEDSERAMVNVTLAADDSKFTANNLSDNAFRNISGTINNTNIDANGYKNGLKNDAGLALAVTGNSNLTFTGATGEGAYDIALLGNASLSVGDTAVVSAEKTSFGTPENVTGNVISKADVIYVQFEKADVDTTGADNEREKDIYNIVLVGDDAEKINELASADLTFAFDGTKAVEDGDLSYAITSKEGVTLSQTGKATEKDRFMFNFNGVNGSYEETGYEIILGQVTINGYGKYTFGMKKDATTNAVYATEIRNNIVDGFTPAAGLILNGDVDGNGPLVGVIEKEITVPVQKLTINVTFPNAVKTDNAKLYQGMQVKIEGGNIKKELALGEKTYAEDATVLYPATVTVNNNDFVITAVLPYNTTYTVTVSGAGYRTATYSVVLTGDKELTFWNNVMDDDKEIEKNNANSKRTTSFLAGDIVKDNKINIYDLSAVVSYFGKIDLTEAQGGEDFAKYDLDRDGKIDAKDVAYVLVSWGN